MININGDLELAMGLSIEKHAVNKFGVNLNVTAGTKEDIWDGGGIYPFPTAAIITKLSQKTDQIALRDGVIEIQGLDANWDLVVQKINLNASDTTVAVTLSTALNQVFRLKVLANVVGNANVTVHNDANTQDYAIITAGNNQTLMSIYTVPRGKTAYLTSYYCTVVDATNKTPISTRFAVWIADRDNNYEFQLKNAIGIPKAGNMIKQYFHPYIEITQKCDIKITANPVGEDADVASGFDLILIDN